MAFSRPFKMQTLGAIPQKLSRRRETMLTGYARRSCSLKCKFDLIKTAIFDRCFFAFLSVPRTFELLFHGRNTLLNHVFLINDSVNICLFSKSGNSLIILFNIQKFRAVPASSMMSVQLFFHISTIFSRKEVSPMSFVLTIFLILYLSNSNQLTPIHIWVIEFFVLGFIACIIGTKNEK